MGINVSGGSLRKLHTGPRHHIWLLASKCFTVMHRKLHFSNSDVHPTTQETSLTQRFYYSKSVRRGLRACIPNFLGDGEAPRNATLEYMIFCHLSSKTAFVWARGLQPLRLSQPHRPLRKLPTWRSLFSFLSSHPQLLISFVLFLGIFYLTEQQKEFIL